MFFLEFELGEQPTIAINIPRCRYSYLFCISSDLLTEPVDSVHKNIHKMDCSFAGVS